VKRKTAIRVFAGVVIALCSVGTFAREARASAHRASIPDGLTNNVEPAEIIELMASFGSRLTGSLGCGQAADYIREQFESIGLENVQEHSFNVPVPVQRTGHITAGGIKDELHSVWPNSGRTPKTVSEGLSGHLVYCGTGTPVELNGLELEGAIALMEFNCGINWLNVAQFAPSAIVFIEPPIYTFRKEAEDKFLQIPASIHRYYMPRQTAARILGAVLGEEIEPGELHTALLTLNEQHKEFLAQERADYRKKHRAVIQVDVLWENATARNIVGTIDGTDPDLAKETIIIESYYDSTSAIPSLAPGAESANGIAVLLEAAKAFKANPPRRTVRFLATAGHFQALAGMRHWVRDYWVWESLMGNGKGMNNHLFAPPRTVWPSPEEMERYRETGGQPKWVSSEHPVMYVSLDLSTRSEQTGIFYKSHFYDVGGTQDEMRYRRRFTEICRNTLSAADGYVKRLGLSSSLVSCIEPIRGRDWRSYVPGTIALNSEVAIKYGKAGIAFATVNDSRPFVNTPFDTVDEVDFEVARQQAALVVGMLWDLSSRVYEIPTTLSYEAAEVYVAVSEDSLINFLPGSVLPGALLAVELSPNKSMMGVSGMAMAMSGTDGRALVVGTQNVQRRFIASRADSRDGSIEYVAAQGAAAPRTPDVDSENWEIGRKIDRTIPLFECAATLIFDIVDQLNYRTFGEVTILQASTDATARNYAAFIGPSSLHSSYSEPCAVIFSEPGDGNVKIIASAGPLGARFTLINTQDATSQHGDGYPVNQRENMIKYTTYKAARDMWYLNEFRLRQLEASGVRNARATFLHQQSGQYLREAEKNLSERNYRDFLNNSRDAWAYGARAYPNVRNAADDVIKGLIFYLAVLLPFAVFGERLIFSFSDIRHRLAGIGGLFVAIYVVLNFVHPGFKLATTPIIILAGFFMLVLGMVTIGILINKFNTQMALMREKSGVWHRQDVARGAAAGAAFMLGISNLRRRKTRTLLTSLTIVLLTFTVLSFTSFETSVAHNVIPTDYDMTYQGILIRRRDWSTIETHAAATLMDQWKQGKVAKRMWLCSQDPNESKPLELARLDDARQATVWGMLGLDTVEQEITQPAKTLAYGEWFHESLEGYPEVVILPDAVASRLGINENNYRDARLKFFGKEISVAGIVRSADFGQIHDIDSEIITPVNYREQAAREGKAGQAGGQAMTVSDTGDLKMRPEEQPPEQYEHWPAGDIAIFPNDFLKRFQEASIRSIAVGLEDYAKEEIQEMLGNYVPRSRLILFSGIRDEDGQGGVWLYSSRDALSARGMQALFLPIAIASLIVFNTMLGSVYERLREIAVYTSCGLAPVHVAALFLAEASVFATMGGYLLGQSVAKVVTGMGTLAGINLNYSSVSAVYTILLVVTLYPARKAVQISVPDETKKMKLPKPSGDVWEFVFPFTVSPVEALGLTTFIYDYFKSHNEDSGGVFCADSVKVERDETPNSVKHALDSVVWVEPMDMGISQKVLMETLPPPPDDKVCSIKFTITRLSGEVETWKRMNLGFLKAIRKQMLIWRLVDEEHKTEYDQQGKQLLSQSIEV